MLKWFIILGLVSLLSCRTYKVAEYRQIKGGFQYILERDGWYYILIDSTRFSINEKIQNKDFKKVVR